MNLSRPFLLPCLALAFALHASGRPNVLFITADDLGWNSLGCTRNPFKGLSPNVLSVSNPEADNSVAAQLTSFLLAEGYEVNLFAYELRDFIKYLTILKNVNSPK